MSRFSNKIILISAAAITAIFLIIFDKKQIFQAVDNLPDCSKEAHKHLIGWLNVTFQAPHFHEIAASLNSQVQLGGYYRPMDCHLTHGASAVIIPYRKRDQHLRALLHHLHPILQRQKLEYIIIVVEQLGNEPFNRGMLMNIGFDVIVNKFRENFQCFIFHDVDLFLENDRARYTCSQASIHFSSNYHQKNWGSFFGGVSGVPKWHFEGVNGYSNLYPGWGEEDNDMYIRLDHLKLPVVIYPKDLLSFAMMKHRKSEENKDHGDLADHVTERMSRDGLNSLNYKVVNMAQLPTHTHVFVQFNSSEMLESFLRGKKA